MTKKILSLGMLSLLVAAGAQAAPINLLTNGSFETGDLTGWTTSGTQLVFPPAVVITNGATPCCFGEAVPADTIVGGSPDAAGTHGVYFVDDVANQFLTQTVFLTAGSYEVGFDAYSPFNGFANPVDASFSGTIAGVLLANYTVHTQNTPGVWVHFAGIANVLADGNYSVSFNYKTLGVPAADVVIDRAYITASEQGGGTPIGVPEPASFALFGAGLVGAMIRRRHRK